MLCASPRSELAHRKGRRLRIALDACRGAREQNHARAFGEHAPRRLLRHEKAAERRDGERLLDFRRNEIDHRTARAVARVVDDHVRIAERAGNVDVELLHRVGAYTKSLRL
jgi:hypothetical protein